MKESLTGKGSCSATLPRTDSGFESAIGVTGRDDVLLIVGVNNFAKENDLWTTGLSVDPADEAPRARIAAFSISEVERRNLKLTRGRRLLKDGFPLDDDGLDDTFTLAEDGLGIEGKFTFIEVGLGVGGMFILTKLRWESSIVLEGISRKRLGCLGC